MKHVFFSILILTSVFILSCNGKKTDSKSGIEIDTSLSRLNSPEIKAINEKLRANPNDPELFFQRGKLYLNNRDYLAAIQDAKRCLLLDSMSKDQYYILLADGYFMGNETKLSKQTLERCLKNLPNSVEANLKLAELYFYVKKYQEAITFSNNALKIDESAAKAYFLKGMSYKESGDTNNAISSFQTASEQDAEYYAAFVELGDLFGAKKNTVALDYYNSALRIDPKSTEVILRIGKFYQDIKKIKEALDYYEKTLQLDPKNRYAWYNKGAIEYGINKDVNKAMAMFSKAIECDPNYAEAFFARGVCYEEKKDLKNAEADYRMALSLRPNYENAVENLNRLVNGK